MQTYSVTTLTVSLDAIEKNFRIARSYCAPEVRQIAVVKDDAGRTVDYLLCSNTNDLRNFPAGAYHSSNQRLFRIFGWNNG